jgi:hypothetical protein
MRVVRIALSLVLIFPSCSQLNAQQLSIAVKRDPQAIAILTQAITAMGGPSAVAQIQSVIAQGSIIPAPGTNAPSGSFIWEDQFAAQGHEFKATFQSGSLTQIFVSGHGSPGLVSNGKIRSLAPYVASTTLPFHIPAVVLASMLANTNCNIEFVGLTTLNDQTAIQIHLHIDTDLLHQTSSVQDWYFDKNTSLPLRVEYRVLDTHLSFKYATIDADYSDYRAAQGSVIPFRIATTEDGTPRNIVTLTAVSINPPVSTSDFDLSTGGGL